MARGQQKIQSQAKANEKAAKAKKAQGHNVHEQKKAAAKALVHACAVCKVCCVLLYIVGLSSLLNMAYFPLGSNARPQDVQAAFWEQTSQKSNAGRFERCCCLISVSCCTPSLYFSVIVSLIIQLLGGRGYILCMKSTVAECGLIIIKKIKLEIMKSRPCKVFLPNSGGLWIQTHRELCTWPITKST